MAAPTNAVRFEAAGYGTSDFVVASAPTGFVTPEAANVIDGKTYRYYAQSADGTQWQAGFAPYVVSTHTLAQSLGTISGTSNGDQLPVNFRLAPIVDMYASPSASLDTPAQADFAGMTNGTLVASAVSGALTVAVKTFAGADPSITDPVYFFFRNNTLASGSFTRIAVTAGLSTIIPSTTTFGLPNNQGTRLWIAAFNNAGTVVLGATICSDALGVFCPSESVKYTAAVYNSTNFTRVFYAATAVGTAAPWRFLGFCEWTLLVTAGTWVAPDIIQLFGPGIKKPGDVVQVVRKTDSTQVSTSSASYGSTSLSTTIAPTSAANPVKVSASGTIYNTIVGNELFVSLFRDSTQIGNFADLYGSASAVLAPVSLLAWDMPSATSSTNYLVKIRSVTGTVVWNQNSLSCELQVEEIMG